MYIFIIKNVFVICFYIRFNKVYGKILGFIGIFCLYVLNMYLYIYYSKLSKCCKFNYDVIYLNILFK